MRHPSLLLLLATLAHGAETRTWTDVEGREVKASMVRLEGESVILKLGDGREVPYPLAKLSDPDRWFAKDKKNQAAANVPKAGAVEAVLNFDDPWPDTIRFQEDPEISVVEEDADKRSFIYESANFRYVCDVRLSKSVVKGFAVLFEATHLYCRTLPLAINGGVKTKGKFKIQLFETVEDYVKAGGPVGSAGVFIGGKNAVLVPLDSLGVKPLGSGYTLDRDKSSKTIPHELTHQLSPRGYFAEGAMGWFSEGIAEYVATTPYRSGIFNVRSNLKPIIEYVTAYGAKEMGGRALGNEIELPDMKTFMMQDYASFQEQPQLGYGVGLLMTTYFLHMDGEGDGKRMKTYLKSLHDGKEGEEALAFLLDGRSFKELQEDFTKAWSRKGVDFEFREP